MRVLFLTHRLPYAPNRGDRIRAYHLLRILGRHAEIDLVSLTHDSEEASHIGDLKHLVSSVATAPVSRSRNLLGAMLSLPTSRPLTHALLNSRPLPALLRRLSSTNPPDVVLVFCSGVAPYALQSPLAHVPFVLDMVDVDSRKWSDLATSAALPLRYVYSREARTLGAFESTAVRRAYATTVVNDREREAMLAISPGAPVHVVPNGIDIESFRPRSAPAESPRVVFCGVFNYQPNEEGALWLAREVWPQVRADHPEARLALVGMNPTTRVRELSRDPSIEVTGAVQDVRPYLWASAIGVAPLKVARGIQNKVLEAVAAGLPCVVTPQVAAGLPAAITPACLVAGEARAFARAIGELLRGGARERMHVAARAETAALSWEQQLSPIVTLLQEAARTAAPSATQ